MSVISWNVKQEKLISYASWVIIWGHEWSEHPFFQRGRQSVSQWTHFLSWGHGPLIIPHKMLLVPILIFLSKTFYFHSIMPILWWHSSFSLFITATAVLASLMPGMLSVLEFPFFLSSIFTIKHLKCFYCDVQGFHAKILDLCSLLRIFTSLLVTLIRYICWVWKPPTTLHPGYWTARESA